MSLFDFFIKKYWLICLWIIPYWSMLPHATSKDIVVRKMCCQFIEFVSFWSTSSLSISPFSLSKWSSQVNTFMFTSFILLCHCIFSQNMLFVQFPNGSPFYSSIAAFNTSGTYVWPAIDTCLKSWRERSRPFFFFLPVFTSLFKNMAWNFFHSDSESSLVLWERADAVNPVVVC